MKQILKKAGRKRSPFNCILDTRIPHNICPQYWYTNVMKVVEVKGQQKLICSKPKG